MFKFKVIFYMKNYLNTFYNIEKKKYKKKNNMKK